MFAASSAVFTIQKQPMPAGMRLALPRYIAADYSCQQQAAAGGLLCCASVDRCTMESV